MNPPPLPPDIVERLRRAAADPGVHHSNRNMAGWLARVIEAQQASQQAEPPQAEAGDA